jgi:hypothetical protein
MVKGLWSMANHPGVREITCRSRKQKQGHGHDLGYALGYAL